ncbi:AraC family transcriptional regulator [Neobacillus niacini]|uniref:AraC family transcriptional regulator n=1 Tax=Neobacillus niacini TaxID=86668 RepID=UPI000ADC107E|nr:AraC family transcriptional regulator [Neobacillus niacini]
MKELPMRFVTSMDLIPLQVYSVGSDHQRATHRPVGFSATQVFITLSGSGRFRINENNDLVVKKNQALIIYEGVPHEYFPITEEPWIVGWISFRGASVSTMLTSMNFHNGELLLFNHFEQLWKLVEQIWLLAKTNSTEELWEISKLLYSFLLELRKQTTSFSRQTPKVNDAIPCKAILDHVTNILREHYTQPLQLSEVIKSSGYSHQHINRLSRQFYGVTLNQYLQNLRILHAVDLIERNKHITLSEIAEDLGMDKRYFTRFFKKNMGISTGEFKRVAQTLPEQERAARMLAGELLPGEGVLGKT